MTAKDELAGLQQGSDLWSPYLPKPTLRLRARLAQFALENGLKDEGEALIIMAARYIRMAEGERFAGWFNGEEAK